jgi:hypothetical protein
MADPTRRDTVDEVVNDLDELKTTVEELQEEAPADEQRALEQIRADLDDAGDAADDIEDHAE